MDTQEQLVVQQCLLNSQMTFSTPEQSGIIQEVARIREGHPELTVIEVANAQIELIKSARGLGDDTKSRIRGEIAALSQKAKLLSEDSVGNERELKEVLRQIDKLQGQL